MTGSVYVKKDKWYIRLSYKDKNNKWTQKWVGTGYDVKGNKRNAEAMIPELVEQHQHLEYGVESDNSRIPFTEAAKQWLARKQGKVERSTYEGLTIYVNKHIIPYFDKLTLYLEDITPRHIRDYYDYKFKGGRCDDKTGGLNVQSIRKHSMVLKQIFGEAVIAEQITRNPALNVPLPKQEQTMRAVFLTGGEANRLLQAFAGHELQPMVYVTLYYGLRRSEVLGLRWQSVDFEADTIRIEHTVVKNMTVEYKNKTKSKTSMADFPLLPEVKELLLKLKKQQNENRKTFGNTYIESDYIFVWQDGKLYRPEYITRAFQRFLRENGFPQMRFHDLRHSTASILHDNGWSLKDIQEWLRHADIETTGNIYTHITNQRKQKVAKNLGETFVMKP